MDRLIYRNVVLDGVDGMWTLLGFLEILDV